MKKGEKKMPYTVFNFKTKKQLKEAVAAGKRVKVYQPGPFGPDVQDGRTVIEGPHGLHRWYASVEVKDGVIIKVTA